MPPLSNPTLPFPASAHPRVTHLRKSIAALPVKNRRSRCYPKGHPSGSKQQHDPKQHNGRRPIRSNNQPANNNLLNSLFNGSL
jgi:hypothetical protein